MNDKLVLKDAANNLWQYTKLSDTECKLTSKRDRKGDPDYEIYQPIANVREWILRGTWKVDVGGSYNLDTAKDLKLDLVIEKFPVSSDAPRICKDLPNSFTFMHVDGNRENCLNTYSYEVTSCDVGHLKNLEDGWGDEAFPISAILYHIAEGNYVILPDSKENFVESPQLDAKDLLDTIKTFTSNGIYQVQMFEGAWQIYDYVDDIQYNLESEQELIKMIEALTLIGKVLERG